MFFSVNLLGNISFLTLFASMIFYWLGISFDGFRFQQDKNPVKNSRENLFSRFGRYAIIISNILLGSLLVLRWKESGHFPLSNLYESLMFLSWCFTGLHLFFFPFGAERPFGQSPVGGQNGSNEDSYNQSSKGPSDKLLGAITTPSALFTNAFATFTLPTEMQEASPLVPALQSNWLMMHVTVMILSYAALILGSLLSVAYLIIILSEEQKQANALAAISSESPQITSVNPGIYQNNQSEVSKINQVEFTINYPNNFVRSTNTVVLNPKMKLAWILDNLSYRILGIGFPFLTIGILSGAVWANEAWGSYWSWDPKETWALLTWLIFAIYLHIRLNKGWEGKKPAIIASFGFIIVWICYLGVNLIGEGLHSYGWIVNS